MLRICNLLLDCCAFRCRPATADKSGCQDGYTSMAVHEDVPEARESTWKVQQRCTDWVRSCFENVRLWFIFQ